MSLSSFRNLLLAGALLIGVGLAGLVAWRWQAGQADDNPVTSMLDNVDVALTDIDYRHLEDGVTRWRLQAKQVARQSAGSGLEIEQPQLVFFNPEGERIGSLSAAAGKVSDTYRQVQVSGEVVLETVSGYTVYTDAMHYDHDQQRITSSAQVEAVGNGIDLTGRGLEVDIGARQLRILADVQAVYAAGRGRP